MGNKHLCNELKLLYGIRCMLTGLQEEDLTFHHITKKSKKGKSTVANGALLLYDIHQWLHNTTEKENIETYYLIKDCLELYKQCIIDKREDLIDLYTNEVMPLFEEEYYEQRRLRKAT